MKTLLVIPARYDSTRLPGKVLLMAHGKPLLQHVWERACKARRVDRVVVATDDRRIKSACRAFGAECIRTSARHRNGTSRCGEVARRLRPDRIINVQADEPDIRPSMIDRVAALLGRHPMSTLATPLEHIHQKDPNRVKVVTDKRGCALYFSRSLIPHGTGAALLHLGIYGYRREVLLRLLRLPVAPLERSEQLEQLRALTHGIPIAVGVVRGPWPGGIDTPADLRRLRSRKKL